MSEQNGQNQSYVSLGQHLRRAREQSKLTLAEVSGAVEIDEAMLARIEAGTERPSEDILLLLIHYFDVQDLEAVQLWQLGNYGSEIPEEIVPETDAKFTGKTIVMLMATDMRTMYSDGLEIIPGKTGLTLSFTQNANDNQSMPVSRIGMSYEQAATVVAELQLALLKAKYAHQPRRLPPTTDTTA